MKKLLGERVKELSDKFSKRREIALEHTLKAQGHLEIMANACEKVPGCKVYSDNIRTMIEQIKEINSVLGGVNIS